MNLDIKLYELFQSSLNWKQQQIEIRHSEDNSVITFPTLFLSSQKESIRKIIQTSDFLGIDLGEIIELCSEKSFGTYTTGVSLEYTLNRELYRLLDQALETRTSRLITKNKPGI